MRELIIDGHYFFVQDFPSVKAVNCLQERDIVGFLCEYIIDWDLDLPIKPSVVAKLSWETAKQLLLPANEQLQQLNNDTQLIYSGLERLIMSEGKIHLLPEHPLMKRYAERLRLCLPAVDNECNLITLPSGHNIETMRYDDFVIVEAIITAKNKALEKKQKQLRR